MSMRTKIEEWKDSCHLYQFFEIFWKKRMMHIFQCIATWYNSFSWISKRLPKINPKILSERLDTLIEYDLIIRNVSQWKPLRINYELSEKWKSLHEQFQKLNLWVLEHPVD
jgi:DNA-binding HxlR family transcriptional regulator